MKRITDDHVTRLLQQLAQVHSMTPERAEAVIHALVDIQESVEKLYNELLPRLHDAASSDVQDALWDIREEFRHILYHIEDAQMTEL